MSDGLVEGDESLRRCLLEQINTETRKTAALTGCSALSERVQRALAVVPRHRFVPSVWLERAYVDAPLPIGHGQTISQPFIVALMTELLAPDSESVVLEVGTGSGYQTAVLAHLAQQVYSVERIPVLAEAAERRLRALGISNVDIHTADGTQGWEEKAPFDGIMVTAAAGEVPPALVQQLKPGGRLIIPVGPPHHSQELRVVCKDSSGMPHSRGVLSVIFVPLIPGC
ncbi:MAG: protein-L-isoaspartate(D-aspartate) O-methyltransferase [Phycisphaerales bacterium]|nr:protein-L-isoaspartate(D-aspartate) O-methyltransferase [Phycisphaerales bacterium]